MNRKMELLAPGGDLDSIKAAIIAGADAIYCGLEKFNARNKASNIDFNQLQRVIRVAHQHHCQIFVTLNIILVDAEMPAVISLLNKLVNTAIDGVIVQDLGLIHLLNTHFKTLKIHASTQLTTHNQGQLAFLSKLNVGRVNLSRELNINEIKSLTENAHQHNMQTEVFVHGSNCICFSGICYMSSILSGNSGNRGRCSQPCRDAYQKTPLGTTYPLNLKDNSAFFDLVALEEAGVDALKIEGRIKKFHYVYTVVDAWRRQLDQYRTIGTISSDNSALYQVFNRDFSNTFLQGAIHKSMFIDNPRDHSAIHHSENHGGISDANLDKSKGEIYNERTEIIQQVKEKIDQLNFEKAPLTISISGIAGKPLKINIHADDVKFTIFSSTHLQNKGTQPITEAVLFSRLKSINETGYCIQKIDLAELAPDLFLPFKEISTLKRDILAKLNNIQTMQLPVNLPAISGTNPIDHKPVISILISDLNEVSLFLKSSNIVYFELPSAIKSNFSDYVTLFSQNPTLIPWFPPIMMDSELQTATEFLIKIKPKIIVANNTGIAYQAFINNISWIAGPYLNNTNSFQLICFKELMNCKGAFISNEISKMQLKGIKKPENFDLYYSIYHPQTMMTSRQCLFQSVVGCEKEQIDQNCIPSCEKRASITTQKQETVYIVKTKGNYPTLFHSINYLNTEVVHDFPALFSQFLIDLRNLKTDTQVVIDKPTILKHFHELLNSDAVSTTPELLKKLITPTTCTSYYKGI